MMVLKIHMSAFLWAKNFSSVILSKLFRSQWNNTSKCIPLHKFVNEILWKSNCLKYLLLYTSFTCIKDCRDFSQSWAKFLDFVHFAKKNSRGLPARFNTILMRRLGRLKSFRLWKIFPKQIWSFLLFLKKRILWASILIWSYLRHSLVTLSTVSMTLLYWPILESISGLIL